MQPESGAVSPEPGQMQQLPGQAASSTSDSQAGVAVATPAVTPEVDSVRTAVLKDFASRLGAETKSGPNGARARPDITRCLNRDPSDPAGGAICSLMAPPLGTKLLHTCIASQIPLQPRVCLWQGHFKIGRGNAY